MNVLFIVGLFCLGVTTCFGETVVVNLGTPGMVKGSAKDTNGPISGNKMYAFYGIPYGDDTSGDKRFKPANEAPAWTGVKDCRTANPDNVCPQLDSDGNPIGVEDCLQLSVYTPHKLPSQPDFGNTYFPVLVIFHTGKLLEGSNYVYDGSSILNSNEIILVVPNYRLGLLGFMCAHVEDAPCNAGMYDQLLALKWVKNHIPSFGGDPSRVTAAGLGLSGATVNHLMFYDTNHEYFQRMIVSTSSSIVTNAIDETPLESAQKIGASENVGCDIDDAKEFVTCMQSVPHQNLTRNFKRTSFSGAFPAVQMFGTDRLIPKDPKLIMSEGGFSSVRTLFGSTSQAGSTFLALMYKLFLEPRGFANNPYFWRYMCMPWLERTGNLTAYGYDRDYIFERSVYPNNVDEAMSEMIDACGSMYYKIPVSLVASALTSSGTNPASVYSFDFQGSVTSFDKFKEYPVFGGVTHGDDWLYLFTDSSDFSSDEQLARDAIVRVYIDFVVDGTINGAIMPYTDSNRQYLEITDGLAVRNDFKDTWVSCKGTSGTEDNCDYVP